MGLLDNFIGTSIDDPKTAATMAMVEGLLSPGGGMRGLSRGLLGYSQQMAQSKQQALMQQMHDLQLQQAKRQAAMQEAMDAAAKASTVDRSGAALSGGGGPTMANAAKMDAMPSFDWAGYANRMAGINPMQALQLQQALRKEQPKFSTAPQYDQNGRAFVLAEDGTMRYLDGVTARDKLISEDLGGKKVFRTEYSANPVASADKTMTTGDMVAMRGQNMTDARARELNAITREGQQTQVVNSPDMGITLVNKGTGLARPAVGLDGKPVPTEASVVAGKLNSQLGEGIRMARDLIPKATNSGAGALIDKGMNFVGQSTDGAVASNQLKTLSGWMTANVPRMQGPQSDKDVAMYRQMAAAVGDETLPAKQRLAALDTLDALQKKYALINQSSPMRPQAQQPMQVPGLKFLGFEGQ